MKTKVNRIQWHVDAIVNGKGKVIDCFKIEALIMLESLIKLLTRIQNRINNSM